MKDQAPKAKKSKGTNPAGLTADRKPSSAADSDRWTLRLYIAGQTPKSVAALANLNAFCKEQLADTYKIEVIDLLKEPWHARTDQIVAIPTLVRRMPVPVRKIIGDLSDKERVLVGFDMQRTGETSFKARQ
jgi:circadian clock protein KaiB